MTNGTPETRDAFAYIDGFTTLAQVRQEMERLDRMEDRAQAGYGYMRLIERVAGKGPAAPEKAGMMAESGAVTVLKELGNKLDQIGKVDQSVDELRQYYRGFVSQRLDEARKSEEAAQQYKAQRWTR